MPKCKHCNKESITISQSLGVCVDCIRRDFKNVRSQIEKAHTDSRKKYGLPVYPPNDPDGISCKICVNECKIPADGISYCGLRTNKDRKRTSVSQNEGNLEWYYDTLPTNCVADWVCPAGTGAGYPEYSCTEGPEIGYKNLAAYLEKRPVPLYMDDLPTTSRNHAFGCLDIARKKGLKHVRIGNIHLLGEHIDP